MKTLVAIVVIILVAGGVYYYIHNRNNSAGTYTAPTNQSADNSSNSASSANSSAAGNTSADNSTASAPVVDASVILNKGSNSTLGTYLIASSGMTLYHYTKDTAGKSNCTGQCAVQWPPYTVTPAANLNAVAGISGKIGTITRDDGTMQVTYNGEPLYFWYKDEQIGDTKGQNVGGVWFVVKP